MGLAADGTSRQVLQKVTPLLAALVPEAAPIRVGALRSPRGAVAPRPLTAVPTAVTGMEVVKVVEALPAATAAALSHVRAVAAPLLIQAAEAARRPGAALVGGPGPRAVVRRVPSVVAEGHAGRHGGQVLRATAGRVPRAEGVAKVVGAWGLLGPVRACEARAAHEPHGATR